MNAYRALAAGACAAAILLAAASAAQDMLGSPTAGRELALEVCAECHWAAKDQFVIPESEAPSFFELADNPAYTPISLRIALRTPHRNMPNLMLSQSETDDIVAYIMELRANR